MPTCQAHRIEYHNPPCPVCVVDKRLKTLEKQIVQRVIKPVEKLEKVVMKLKVSKAKKKGKK